MNWILLTILTFISSIILYVLVRLGKSRNTQPGVLNFSMFALPSVLTAVYILINDNLSFRISPQHLLIIFVAALFFSYLGNFLSIKGIQYAKNPGFSLMIQKSYGALTLFLAPLFFKASIDLKGILGTFLIIIFGVVLSFEKGKKLSPEKINGFLSL